MNKDDKIKTIAIYIRVSTEEQAKKGYSLDSQLTRLKEYAKQKGYRVYNTYVDEGKSARSNLNQRKALLELLEAVKEKRIDRIIFWRLDRWFRNVKDYYKVQDILEQNNVDWECSDEEYNTTTSNGRLYLNIKLSIAQNESDQTGDRIRFNFENMIKSGKAIIGTRNCPIGFKVEGEPKNKHIVKNPDDEAFVNDLFNTYEETMSLRYTNKILVEKYPQYHFVYRSLKHMITNPLFYGSYKGVDNYCEAYLTKERWNNIQDIIKTKNQKQKIGKCKEYLFTGLLTCPVCGRRLSANGQHRVKANGDEYLRVNYRCPKHWVENKCPNNKVIQEDLIEEWLLNNYKYLLEEYIYQVEDIKEQINKTDNISKIKKIEDKLNRLNELYIEGIINREKYDKDRAEYNKQLTELKFYKDDIFKVDLDKIRDIINDKKAIEIYHKLNRANKRLFWNSFIDRLVFIGNKDYDFTIYLK